jgi:alanine racemase/UDP-N-acetylmuramoyl-tripeptide--D-alanyl-D-alanine ligase
MNRLGVSKAQAIHLYRAIKNASYLHLEGAMTHFAAAESPTFDSFTYNQIDQFKQFLDMLPSRPRWIHAANSGAAVRFNIPFCNLVRIGLGAVGYGYCLDGVKPALSFTSSLASISFSNKGETVGYNCTYKIKKHRSRIGVIPVGYHDGFHRVISGKGYVLIRGKKAPMIGTICMDFMMIDLTEVPEAEVGDEILLFGSGLSPEIIAAWAKTDVRELLAGLPLRVRRLWVNLPRTYLQALNVLNPGPLLLEDDGNRQSILKKYHSHVFITSQEETIPKQPEELDLN